MEEMEIASLIKKREVIEIQKEIKEAVGNADRKTRINKREGGMDS